MPGQLHKEVKLSLEWHELKLMLKLYLIKTPLIYVGLLGWSLINSDQSETPEGSCRCCLDAGGAGGGAKLWSSRVRQYRQGGFNFLQLMWSVDGRKAGAQNPVKSLDNIWEAESQCDEEIARLPAWTCNTNLIWVKSTRCRIWPGKIRLMGLNSAELSHFAKKGWTSLKQWSDF